MGDKRKQNGQSLVGLLATISVFSIGFLSIQKGIINNVKSSRDLDGRRVFNDLSDNVRLILNHQMSCDLSFKGIDLTPLVSDKKNPNSLQRQIAVKLGDQKLAYQGAQLNNLTLTNVMMHEPNKNLRESCGGVTTYAMQLSIQAKKKVYVGSRQVAQTHLVYLRAGADNVVLSCSLGSSPCAPPVPPSPPPQSPMSSRDELQVNLLASVMDAYTTQRGGNGAPARQIFKGQNFNYGSQKLFITTVSGRTIYRLAFGSVATMPCDPRDPATPSLSYPTPTSPYFHHSWFIYFRDSSGKVIGDFSRHYQDPAYALTAYFQGVKVPPNASTAWIGFFDNVQTGDSSSYDDNEGKRNPATYGQSSLSTNGCTFNLRLEVTTP